MATASKLRRPVMATPPPKSRVNTYTIEEKQQLLDNFDLEGEYCTPCHRRPLYLLSWISEMSNHTLYYR